MKQKNKFLPMAAALLALQEGFQSVKEHNRGLVAAGVATGVLVSSTAHAALDEGITEMFVDAAADALLVVAGGVAAYATWRVAVAGVKVAKRMLGVIGL